MTAIVTLPRVVAAAEGKPVRPEAMGNQELMATLVRDPATWTPELADLTSQGWDAMAANWNGERGGYRAAPLCDALERGRPFPSGRCLEVCCGTGLLTADIETVWPDTVSVDLSAGMLDRAESRRKARTDVSRLPFAAGSFAAAVIADGPLFAGEVTRVLAPGGVLVWSNALGTGAPYFIETAVLVDVLSQTGAGPWHAVESEASWGSWAVLRRSGAA